MNMLNSVIIEGGVVRDLEDKPNYSDFELVSTHYSVDSEGKKHEENNRFTVEVFGKLAEFCQDRLVKGRGVRVVGRLKVRNWKDENGNEFSRVVIIAEHIEFKRYKLPEERADSDVEKTEESPEF